MCPIVPMFTCGLLRSNFSFAISMLLIEFEVTCWQGEQHRVPDSHLPAFHSCLLLGSYLVATPPLLRLIISSARFLGTSSYWPKCMVKLPRPCVRERSSVA